MFEKIMGMFSITGRPRETDPSDTRQDIRRHDPEQERKKQPRPEKEKLSFDIGDSASVSVEALRLFLENFLRSLEKDASAKTAAKIPAAPAQPQQTPPPTPPAQGRAARAASAYRHVGNANRATSILDAAGAGDETAPAISLPASEVRTIHRLLEDLKILAAADVQQITVERGESFLQSLVNAVETAKSNL